MLEDLIGPDELKRRIALNKIYAECYSGVRIFVIKHNGLDDDALDVFQEGVLALYDNVKSGAFRNEASIKTYLFKICQNKWYEKYNAAMNKNKINPNGALRDDEDILINTNLIDTLMSHLSPDCSKMIMGFYYQGKSMLELKQEFKLGSVQAAKNKKLRCLRYLMNIIKERGLTYQHFILDK